ncbi:MAG: TIGR00300 family protein [Methanospirillum sp.]|nr:TIGR00300 family protein [Methanospirillum sp.]
MTTSREIELEGHIIDSGIMTRALDRIMDRGGSFEILEFQVGKHKTDPSFARLSVTCEEPTTLQLILSDLHRLGARQPTVEDAGLEPAEADRVAPRGFYSTTNYPTEVKFRGTWLPVRDIEMDCLITVDPAGQVAQCLPFSKLRKEALVVVGEEGVRVFPPERPRETSTFEFMHGTVSSERPSETLIARIAGEMIRVKQAGGRIGLVGGPAIVHTGAGPALAWMVRNGFVDVIFAGNALATHDIECSLFGTSLGMDLATGTPVRDGHRNHLDAIAEILRAGSIADAVEQGIVTSGVMYECVRSGIPYVLAGSIRDDGPLPDVITDTVLAQDAIREHLRGCGMVLMIGTLLHSVAVGNCLPAEVKTICVDINPASVTKLMDRGTMQAIGIVSDAGTFLPLLARALGYDGGAPDAIDGSPRER